MIATTTDLGDTILLPELGVQVFVVLPRETVKFVVEKKGDRKTTVQNGVVFGGELRRKSKKSA